MPNPNAEVSGVIRIELPADRSPAEELRAGRSVSVELERGRRVRLDPADERSAGFAEILDRLSKMRLRVYLEIDPQTSAITRLLIPRVTQVLALRPIDEGALGVELDHSHARHVLRRTGPDFDELESQLREALRTGNPVVLTENDAHEIIDIRGYTPGPDDPYPFPKEKPPFPKRYWWQFPKRWLKATIVVVSWPWWWFNCASLAKAQQVFDAMSATSCNPLTALTPCIPFLYPDDGCFARAHEMCRLMTGMGLKPEKVWIKGDLHVETKNNPICYVEWGWHVAPTLCVRGPGYFQTQEMVVDPSLFLTPVSKATWKNKQGDPSATLWDTNTSVYLYQYGHLADPNYVVTDPNYVWTDIDLETYRLELRVRTLYEGAPPYATCGP